MLSILADADVQNTVSNWTNTGAMGILAGIIWYFGYKVIPAAMETFRQSAIANSESVKALTQECQATTAALMDRHDREINRRDCAQDAMAKSLQAMAMSIDRYAGRMEQAVSKG
jgi:hypothetical protein